MNVLFLYSYFKPEHTSGAHLADDLRKGLAAAGHSMKVYAPIPTRGVSLEERKFFSKRKNETELNGALEIHRFWLYREGRNTLLRALRYAILELQLMFWGLVTTNADVIPMGSTPPINGLLGMALSILKHVPYVYTVQDVFPDSLVNTGMTTKGSVLYKIGDWVSNLTYRYAAHIIVISDSIKESLVTKGVPADRISVVYNWIDTDEVRPIEKKDNSLFSELNINSDFFSVTYAGNIGNSQNVNILVECAKILSYIQDLQFIIFGDGSEKERLEKEIHDSRLGNIHVFPMQPIEKVSEVYSMGDVSMVICKKGVGGSAFPSKAASIMATGTPIIASFDMESDLCRLVQKEKSGVCVPAEDVEAAVNAILTFYHDKQICKSYGENGRNVALTRFSKEQGVSKRIEILEKYAK